MSHDEWLTEAEAEREAEGEQRPREGDWAWATEHEAPQWASTVQLVSWLARAELPPHTLVWKPGWAEWLPALQVAELADAFPRVSPGRRRVARAAFESEAAPPPVPVAQYPHIRLQTKDALREASAAYPVLVARGFAPTEYVLVKYRDGDLAQQVTKQVPAAAMLEAALAMGAPQARRSESRHWSAEARAGASVPLPTLPPPTLPPLAVELSVPPPSSRKDARDQRESSGFGLWIWFGTLAGTLLGVLSVVSVWPTPELSSLSLSLPAALLLDAQPAPPPAAEPTRELTPQPSIVQQAVPTPQSKLVQQQLAMRPAPSEPSVPPVAARPGRVRVKRSGEPALLNALRVTKNAGFDRMVFEFRERVPGYRIEYVNRPARDCESGQVRRVDGKGRLELQLFPAQAHAEDGEPAFHARELKPALSVVRELERTCDRNGVVTWVVGTSAVNRFRAYELSAPPRLVVQIDH